MWFPFFVCGFNTNLILAANVIQISSTYNALGKTMSKLKINMSINERLPKAASLSAVASTYIMTDGLLNFDAVAKLQDKVTAAIKAAEKAGTPLKITGTYVIKRRAKPVKFSAALEKKGDHKYLVARATKVGLRKRLTPESLARVAPILQLVDDAKLNAELKKAVTAITRHIKKTETVLGKVTKEKGKIRDAANATFDKSVTLLRTLLTGAGVKDTDIVESQGMMGKSVLVRLSKDNIVSVNKADAARFAAAVKAVKAAK